MDGMASLHNGVMSGNGNIAKCHAPGSSRLRCAEGAVEGTYDTAKYCVAYGIDYPCTETATTNTCDSEQWVQNNSGMHWVEVLLGGTDRVVNGSHRAEIISNDGCAAGQHMAYTRGLRCVDVTSDKVHR